MEQIDVRDFHALLVDQILLVDHPLLVDFEDLACRPLKVNTVDQEVEIWCQVKTLDSSRLRMEVLIVHLYFVLQLVQFNAKVVDFLQTSRLRSKQPDVLFVLTGVLNDHVNHLLELVLIPESVSNVNPDFVDLLELLLDLHNTFVLVGDLGLEEKVSLIVVAA